MTRRIALLGLAACIGGHALAGEARDERAWKRFIDGWTREIVIYERFSTALILRGTYLSDEVRTALAAERRRRIGADEEDHGAFVRRMAEDDAVYHEVVFSADSGMAAARDFGTEEGWGLRFTADGVEQPLVTVFRERTPNPLQYALYPHLNRWSDLWIARFGKTVTDPREVALQVGSGYGTDTLVWSLR